MNMFNEVRDGILLSRTLIWTMFCAQYLSSRLFSPKLDELVIKKYVYSGYYGFLDYAFASWYKYAKRVAKGRNASHSLYALQSISEFLVTLGGSSPATRQDPTTKDANVLQQRITDLA